MTSQRQLNKIHNKIDAVFDYVVGAVHDQLTLDAVMDGRESLHVMIDNLRKSADIEDLEDRRKPLNFNSYDQEDTD